MPEEFSEFYGRVKRAGIYFEGVTNATLSRGPTWHFARLGRMRSAGINDLRHGDVVSPDVAGRGMHQSTQAPLPATVRCHALAACLGPDDGSPKARLGDGLVPVASALGQHREPARRLAFDAERQAVVYDTGHLELLSSAPVFEHLKRWLG